MTNRSERVRDHSPAGADVAHPTLGTISVCIVCRNEADKLSSCLFSVAWADELLVMDLESVDESVQIARAHGARVISRAPHPIVEPLRNELAAEACGDWVLALDPDERVAPDLAALLQRLARIDHLHAVVLPRTNYDLGYPPSHPVQRYEPQLRMYRPRFVTWPEEPNKLPQVDEELRYVIPSCDNLTLIHDRNRNVPEAVERIMRYAPAQAQAMIDAGERFTVAAMAHALWRQLDKEVFYAQAWRDGVPGLLRAGILVIYKFYVWTAFWQLSGAGRTVEDDRLVRRAGRALAALRWLTGVVWGPLGLLRRLWGRS